MGEFDLVVQALDSYRPHDASEVADGQRLRSCLTATDVRSRDALLHVTASALVVHPPTRTVLLRWHPRMAMWMQVGGHFDADETDPWLVAVREAREETGLTDLRADSRPDARQPVQIVIVPVPAHGDEPAHEHADIRYLLATDHPTEIVPESGAARLRWTDISVAVEEATEDNLREFLTRIAAILDDTARANRGSR
ncbi:MAG TPA: NUDIX domain-containing protein [Acidimicrobiia bacterium]